MFGKLTVDAEPLGQLSSPLITRQSSRQPPLRLTNTTERVRTERSRARQGAGPGTRETGPATGPRREPHRALLVRVWARGLTPAVTFGKPTVEASSYARGSVFGAAKHATQPRTPVSTHGPTASPQGDETGWISTKGQIRAWRLGWRAESRKKRML